VYFSLFCIWLHVLNRDPRLANIVKFCCEDDPFVISNKMPFIFFVSCLMKLLGTYAQWSLKGDLYSCPHLHLFLFGIFFILVYMLHRLVDAHVQPKIFTCSIMVQLYYAIDVVNLDVLHVYGLQNYIVMVWNWWEMFTII
jgi:hypothetical protein